MADLLTRVLRRIKRMTASPPTLSGPARRRADASTPSQKKATRPPKSVPQTMDRLGLRFLELLAAQKSSGVFLEVGPLFGSSTNAIARGRRNPKDPIHTIDTFEAAPWVRERFGFDLSRALFDRYTSTIEELSVHQGYAPDVVREDWAHRIGFYFDDATHGDPGWTANYDFFAQYFEPDCLICGDDFAVGWPDIIQNVHKLTDAADVRLYVMGRVWAFAHKNPERIEAAIAAAAPLLAGARIITTHKDVERSLPAASWSYGLFRRERMAQFGIDARGCFAGEITARRADGRVQKVPLDGTPLKTWDLVEIACNFDQPIGLDLCLAGPSGRSRKLSRPIAPKERFLLPEGMRIVGLRLTTLHKSAVLGG